MEVWLNSEQVSCKNHDGETISFEKAVNEVFDKNLCGHDCTNFHSCYDRIERVRMLECTNHTTKGSFSRHADSVGVNPCGPQSAPLKSCDGCDFQHRW